MTTATFDRTSQEFLMERATFYSFSVRDRRGREIGARVLYGMSLHTKSDAGFDYGCNAGTYMTASVHPTRDNRIYFGPERFIRFEVTDCLSQAKVAQQLSGWVADQLKDMEHLERMRYQIMGWIQQPDMAFVD